MYLKRIELHGFKTFAPRTAVDLRPGITAVVGPNGSGKSNIADAVRWALGEGNLRQVRCRATEELIFAGSARRASLGMAEVSLVFANEGGWLALPFNEVRITRRAYRSGENEYLINGTRVRLRDVVDLLAGASIHAGGHVVVGQGLVDAVLALRAEERRVLVENLAGLKHYYLRRDDAEARLSDTETNLVQVDVMIAELVPQVESLATQASVLRAYRAAQEELHALQRASFGVQAARLRARAAAAAEAAEHSLAALSSARDEVAHLRAEDEALLATLTIARAALEDVRERLRAHTSAQAAARRDRDVAAARAIAARQAAQDAREEHALLTGRVGASRAAAAAAAAAHAAARDAHGAAEAALTTRRQDLRRLTAARDAALASHRAAEAAAQDAVRRARALAESVALAAAGLDGLAAERTRQADLAAAAAAALAAAERTSLGARDAGEQARTGVAAAREAESRARQVLDAARRAESSAGQAHQEARRALSSLETRRDALREWHERLEGYGAGVRDLAAHPAAAGVVGQALTITSPWQPGLAALLGPLLEALITTDSAALLAAAEALGDRAGQVRLVVAAGDAAQPPLLGDAAGAPSARSALLAPEAALRVLIDRGVLAPGDVMGWAPGNAVSTEIPGLLAALRLDRVLLLRDVPALLRARPHLRDLGLSALVAGQPVAAAADGTLAYGAGERVAGMLRRRDELAALERDVADRAAVEATLAAQAAAARTTVQAAESEHTAVRRALGQAEAAATRARDEARFQERLLDQARQHARAAQGALERIGLDLAAREARRAGDEQRLAALREESVRCQAALDGAHAALAGAEERLSSLALSLRSDDSALALVRDRLGTAAALADERRRGLASLEEDLSRRAGQLQRAEAEGQALAAALESASAREATAAGAAAALEAEIQPLEAAHQHAQERQTAIRAAIRTATERLTPAEVAHDRARRDAENSARDLDVLRAQVAAELSCALEDLSPAPPPPGAAARMRTLRDELAAMGLVNARAEDDYAATAERLHFLQTQANDLRAGVARLREIIGEANTTVRERFASTVADLDRHFAAYFARLFDGGSCRLIAAYDERGLPSGMDVQAQPPGKRTRDLALLSGGERALVALALLFAMLAVRPVPFCLLDEVEAALDESNTGRFGAILRELSAGTQFLLITHNRGTMLHADTLYGVTMSETGISTVAGLALARDDHDALLAQPAGESS